ncbi:MAG: sialidase [Roseburia sp.]|nr:sialidase [Roseburia sp.]MCM1099459.1 sialidase [Ruminococcus flavefaciens]
MKREKRKYYLTAVAAVLAGGLILGACGKAGDSGTEGAAVGGQPGTDEALTGGQPGTEGTSTDGQSGADEALTGGQQAEGNTKMDTETGNAPEGSLVSGEGILPGREGYHLDSFGENVWFFSPEDDPEAVQQELTKLWGGQEKNQFGDVRYAVYFLPGEYDDSIRPKVGFYMQVAGLGAMPDEVSLYTVGTDARWLGDNSNHNATCNFWRGVENLSARDYVTWAVSQATFMRRVHLEKTLYLHDSNGWASGGFLSNSKIELAVNSGSQQQWLSRNCDWNVWIGENWNIVFAGIEEGKTPEGTWPEHAYTDVPVVEEIREKPFLAYDEEKGFGVYVPRTRTQAVGVDWDPGEFLPIEEFYIAKPFTDTAETINEALRSGKHLFLTPGIYQLTEPILVERSGTIVLGTGLATLRSMEGNPCMEVAEDARVTLAGILFDAGPKETEYLLAVGSEAAGNPESGNRETENAEGSQSGNEAAKTGSEGTIENEGDTALPPQTLLADLFFRVGGAKGYNTDVKCCVKINQDNVIGDNFWVWRADHGSGVGWEKNRAANGVFVTGDNVTMYALMVEHFQEYQTIWEGEEGKIIFYQCEIPYDVPDQESWRSHDGKVNGYASVKLGDNVTSHESWGLGIYLYNRDAEVELHSAMEAPEGGEIRVHNICTVMITGNPGMSHIINEDGDAVTHGGARAVLIEWGG